MARGAAWPRSFRLAERRLLWAQAVPPNLTAMLDCKQVAVAPG
jgi:hypothetical protein